MNIDRIRGPKTRSRDLRHALLRAHSVEVVAKHFGGLASHTIAPNRDGGIYESHFLSAVSIDRQPTRDVGSFTKMVVLAAPLSRMLDEDPNEEEASADTYVEDYLLNFEDMDEDKLSELEQGIAPTLKVLRQHWSKVVGAVEKEHESISSRISKGLPL